MDVEHPVENRWLIVNETLRPIAILGMASLLSGVLVGGLGGRLVMSISARAAGAEMAGRITENGNVVGEFTIGGTIGLIVFVGLLGGMIGSIGVVSSDPWLRWMGPLRGLGYGIVVLSVFGYNTFASIDFVVLDPVALNVGMFAGLIVGFGFGVVGFDRFLYRKLPGAEDGEQVGWFIVVVLGAMPLFLSVLFFSPSRSVAAIPPTRSVRRSYS